MNDDMDRSDWLTYKRLKRLHSAGIAFSQVALGKLQDLEAKHTEWDLDGSERDEFAIWSQTSMGGSESVDELQDLHLSRIIPAIRKKALASRFGMNDTWRAFTQSDPVKAFEALKLEKGRSSSKQLGVEWRQLFWTLREPSDDVPLQSAVLDYVIKITDETLDPASDAIANWLHAKSEEILKFDNGPSRVIAAWDRIAEMVARDSADPVEEHNDLMGAVLNDASGVLPDILAGLIDLEAGYFDDKLRSHILSRFDKSIAWQGAKGAVAQACLLQRLPWLETIYPEWVIQTLAPLLNQDDEFWLGRWHARFYHSHPGSQAIFQETKDSFLRTFSHSEEFSNHEYQTNLLLSAILNSIEDSSWPISSVEAKQALLSGAETTLSDVCRLLRGRDKDISGSDHWYRIVKPIIGFAWPLGGQSTTRRSGSGLITLIFEADDAFPDAVAELKDLLGQDWSRDAWDIERHFEKDELEKALKFPDSMLELISQIVDPSSPPPSLNLVLDKLVERRPALVNRADYRKLRSLARKSAA